MTMIPNDGSPEGPGVRFGSYPGRVVRQRILQGAVAVEPPGARSEPSR